MARAPERRTLPNAKPLGRLIASEPPRRARATGAATLASVLLHSLLTFAAVWVTLGAPRAPAEVRQDTTLLQFFPEPPPAPPMSAPPQDEPVELPASEEPPQDPRVREAVRDDPSPAPSSPQVEASPEGGKQLVEPSAVPDSIPPAGETKIDTAGLGGRGEPGGEGSGAPSGRPSLDPDAGPVETPYTVRPELLNPADVESALAARWPRAMRRAGIGGHVDLWLLLDDQGRLVRALVARSSGYRALDKAALDVALVMRFRPALDAERAVSVWITQPVQFQVQ